MSSTNGFAAGVLEASASGYGGVGASLLLERHPEVAERWGRGAHESWKAHLTQRILELAAALRVDDPAVFAERVEWARRSLLARDLPADDLKASLVCLDEVLKDQLPGPAASTAEEYLRVALEALEREPASATSDLDPDSSSGRLALTYLTNVLEGRPRVAIELILEAVDGGLSVTDALLDVLIPAQREIGRLWHLGSASVAEEHLVTGTTERLLVLLLDRAERADPNGRCALVAAVEGNAHELGIRVLAGLLELRGWDVIFLGSNVPTNDLVGATVAYGADVVVLSGSLTTQVRQLGTAVRGLKALDESPPVLVGGAAFDAAPELWERIGADGYAEDLNSAVERAAKLVA